MQKRVYPSGMRGREVSQVRRAVAILALLWLALCPVGCGGPVEVQVKTGQHVYSVRRSLIEANYFLFLPQEYGQDPDRRWPLLLFLHGIAKRGDEPEEMALLLTDGPPLIVDQQSDFPFVVLSPQCPSDSFWDQELDRLDLVLDEVEANYAVDPDRIYLTGLSMGGFGAWHYALRHPRRFAALVPIAGGYAFDSDETPPDLCDLAGLPHWVFHGARDEAVSPRHSQVMVDALRACGADVRFTLYEDADHATAWHRAYADPDLYDWLLQHERAP